MRADGSGRLTLAAKLTMLVAGFSVMAAATVTIVSSLRERAYLRTELEQQAVLLVETLATSAADPLYMLDANALTGVVSHIGSDSLVTSAQVFDPDGRLVTNQEGAHGLRPDSLGALVVAAEGVLVAWGEGNVVAARPLVVGPRVIGGVSVGLSTLPLAAKLRSVQMQGALAALFTSLMATFLALVLLRRWVIHPIRDLAASAREVSSGNLDQSVAVTSADEIGDMQRTFNRMVGDLKQRQADRERSDRERMEMERRALAGQKLESLGVLAGGIAHDFNNLLTGILGNTSLAMEDLAPESPMLATLTPVRTAARRAADLTDQMLTYAGRGEAILETIDVNAAVREMLRLLQASIPKGVELTPRLAPQLPPVQADTSQIRQVVMNLVVNAAEAVSAGEGQVIVETRVEDLDEAKLVHGYSAPQLEPGRFVYLEVKDNGTGMNEHTLQRMFDPFFTTKFTGRGLGLAAVLGILRSHAGAYRVTSVPGGGTQFRIILPASTQVIPVADPAPERTGADWTDLELLVVDDEESVRNVAAKVFRRLGSDVTEAADGVEAVERFETAPGRYSAVVLDLTMPRMDGHDALAAMRRMRSKVPVVLMSGYDLEGLRSLPVLGGPTVFLKKPFTPEELQDAVLDVLQ